MIAADTAPLTFLQVGTVTRSLAHWNINE
uniref:Uncharacterized protein n=1 Tax=Anguilla anguilla TaxID=7936 RepID=A0A0E9VW16_ANGAN